MGGFAPFSAFTAVLTSIRKNWESAMKSIPVLARRTARVSSMILSPYSETSVFCHSASDEDSLSSWIGDNGEGDLKAGKGASSRSLGVVMESAGWFVGMEVLV